MASKDRRKDPVYCIRCPLKVVGLRIGIRTLVFAASDGEMPWRVWTSGAGSSVGPTMATERIGGIVRASSFHDCKTVADIVALLYHRALH